MKLISGDRLKRKIRDEGVSYEAFGKSVDCSKAMIGMLCTEQRRTCTPQLAEAIARRLRLDLDYLFVPSVSLDRSRPVNVQSKKVAA